MDTFRALHLDEEHVGRYIRGEGVEGVLRAFRHIDDTAVDLVLDRPPYMVSIPAGRPLDVAPAP